MAHFRSRKKVEEAEQARIDGHLNGIQSEIDALDSENQKIQADHDKHLQEVKAAPAIWKEMQAEGLPNVPKPFKTFMKRSGSFFIIQKA